MLSSPLHRAAPFTPAILAVRVVCHWATMCQAFREFWLEDTMSTFRQPSLRYVSSHAALVALTQKASLSVIMLLDSSYLLDCSDPGVRVHLLRLLSLALFF